MLMKWPLRFYSLYESENEVRGAVNDHVAGRTSKGQRPYCRLIGGL